jgi:hypothetical protein
MKVNSIQEQIRLGYCVSEHKKTYVCSLPNQKDDKENRLINEFKFSKILKRSIVKILLEH